MGIRDALVVMGAVAAFATPITVRPADIPEMAGTSGGYAGSHRLVPTPIMGIRGDAAILAVAPGA